MLLESIRLTSQYKKLRENVENGQGVVLLFGLPPVARAQITALLCYDLNRPAIVITPSEAEATRFSSDVASFGAKSGIYPARDFIFRNIESQSHEYEHRRLEVLGNIVGKRANVICASSEAALQYTMPKNEFLENTLTIKPNQNIPQKLLIERLFSAGYYRRDRVEGKGQFSVRGGIVDIYPPDMNSPARIDYWGDEVESIYSFDILSQRRNESLKKIYISPAREVLFSKPEVALKTIEHFIENSGKYKENATKSCLEDMTILKGNALPACMDKYLQIRYEKAGTLFDYFENPIIFLEEAGNIREAQKANEFRQNEEIKGLLEEGVLCKGLTDFYLDYTYLMSKCSENNSIISENFARNFHDLPQRAIVDVSAHSVPIWSGSIDELCDDLRPMMKEDYFCAILAGTMRGAKALTADLVREGLPAVYCGKDVLPKKGAIAVMQGHLSSGVNYPFAKFAIISSRSANTTGEVKKRKKNKGLTNLEDLKSGDYVVHQNHGIGQYVGIERLDLQGVVKDYLKIVYAKTDTLYVPVTQLDLLSSYTVPGEAEKVKLAKLGGSDWVKTKARVKKATEDMAKELIALYAKRTQAKGYSFSKDTEWQSDFETRFEYDETDDQLTSIMEIKSDMEKSYPMDRLLCGDVGVGKTEVALRAAFKCVMDGKQCAILVPTTILAWQHYNTLIRRMESFPVNIGLLSRFRTTKQKNKTILDMKTGVCDIVVGTHRMLSKDVKFKDLGLVIIDEEQRFGVKHKEKLKESFIGVDMLTLSATPIPRTLNMAMSGIRDMSSIEQPPFERQPIETYVMEYDSNVIAMALKREIARGGQAYYLHNRVETIDLCAAKVAEMVPEARIATAHGKMTEAQLSDVWQKLLDGEIDILVCTTIIETGVDVRNCNTLVIENSDKMGLAQLYQIRGRVGRSSRKAYSYFTFQRDKVLTDVASKRLSAIREFTSFGSGFRIAMRDLQIRGAGSILGGSQHGHMEAVGYDMYVKMLNKAIAMEKGEAPPRDKSECLIDITVNAFIPEKYIPDTAGRIEAYKRIAAIENREDAKDVTDELKDRYGSLPESVEGLIDISLTRIEASLLGINEINQKRDTLILYSDNLNLYDIKSLLYSLSRRITVTPTGRPYIGVRIMDGEKPIEVMKMVFEKMGEHLLKS